MKAPKNFYNTVDQTKLGIDDLFTRTAENEADITALETVVGNDTTGLVKSVSDLETVVGDLDGGLVKDVHDLQDDSEHYHDDIADLKTADITLGLRIDDVKDDLDPHTFFDINANLTLNVAQTEGTIYISGYEKWGQAITALVNSGKMGRIIAVVNNSPTRKMIFTENVRGADYTSFVCVDTAFSTTYTRFVFFSSSFSNNYPDININFTRTSST